MLFCIGGAGLPYFVSGELVCGILYWESCLVVFCIGRGELSCGILYWQSWRMVFVSGELACSILYQESSCVVVCVVCVVW